MRADSQRTGDGPAVVEWKGHLLRRGLDALAPADVTIIVDVLSFSTCVDIATSRGVAVLPYPWKDSAAVAFADANHAELAGARGRGGFSLSPASFLDAAPGLRCVLPSPNGATLAIDAAARSGVVLAGCLRNASAVAETARRLGGTFNICPAGERWADGSMRVHRGLARVELAADLDVSSVAPRYDGDAFR